MASYNLSDDMEDFDEDIFSERSTLIDNADDRDFIELDTKASNVDPDPRKSLNGDQSHGTIVREKLSIPFSKRTILKNVLVGCTAFLFLFTAFGSVSVLQTSLNREEGIGSTSLSLIYTSIILSCFLPKFLIARLGCKTTLSLAMTGYILYIAANFYATKATMFTGAILVGISAGPLWTSKFTYVTQCGVWYSRLTNQDKEVTISRFFGIFWLFSQSSSVVGNLIAALVFAPTPSQNDTILDTTHCGALFCGGGETTDDNFEQDKEKVFTALGIYVGCSIIALIIVIVLMDPITLDNNDTEENKKLNPKLLLATFKHLFRSPLQMMLVAITIYGGMEKAFLGGVFTQAYISCALGIWNLGYVMVCFGVVGACCSLAFGHLVKYIGRIPFFVLLLIVHEGLLVVLRMWVPDSGQAFLFYVFASLWSVGSIVISTQLNALYGEFFTENSEAAFSNFRLWEAVGFAVAYAYNNSLCTDIKIYICMTLLVVGLIGYAAAEVKFRMDKKRKSQSGGKETEKLDNS